jgi:phage gp36-like protein
MVFPSASLANLYCLPGDVYDQLSAEGADLRTDDRDQATLQTVTATATAPILATAIPVTAVIYPMLAGVTLQFDGGGMADQTPATLSSTARVGDTSLLVNPLTAQISQSASARDTGQTLATARRLLKACQYATAQVKLYCCSRYDDSQLALSVSVNRWACLLATYWLCTRRGQTPPKQVQEDRKDAMEEMKQVRVGMLQIEDIGTRTAAFPFISNFNIDPSYDVCRVRVEPTLSEPTPTQYGQFIDWNSALYLEL